jgi:hypothetical protein
MDVGLTQINQCEESDGTCDEMKKELKILEVVNPEQAGKYKCKLGARVRARTRQARH